ncbi:hypothetical protein DSCO28_32510 [Desulfosarcina ovata subsp. sediminis]|uniref:Uncharacterized protein n=1 Tax=Desulfosarcina ovata subsp. sediminis TaxID=885957 RepID=A0A5K7ZPC5_9BACT|nr:hypothetical protein DSCO28_32510 [Desulfosarcina ovata subsp. sediminis]
MDRLEIIHLRGHSHREKKDPIAAFRQLSVPRRINNLKEISLFQDHALENDLKIIIRWQGCTEHTGKSPLGLQLAAAFSEFGQIRHTAWEPVMSYLTQEAKS